MEPCARVRWKGRASESPSRGVLGPGAWTGVAGRDRRGQQGPLLRCCWVPGSWPSTLQDQQGSGATGAVLQAGAVTSWAGFEPTPLRNTPGCVRGCATQLRNRVMTCVSTPGAIPHTLHSPPSSTTRPRVALSLRCGRIHRVLFPPLLLLQSVRARTQARIRHLRIMLQCAHRHPSWRYPRGTIRVVCHAHAVSGRQSFRINS